ncbi:hypothetical protein AAU57_08900 [Nonlabens sp. YIK11]|uniref:hypothetical protein n=1 Tax=Nonlabens sp. YIK11 TaxID=1453349 RepID=UPI0006DD3365|nr:hypothetical protein [Nonlabens sp. YIK11]KQC33421.1 hypothetical protein AAU57_08900 [Nonlabens sp. YIK11]
MNKEVHNLIKGYSKSELEALISDIQDMIDSNKKDFGEMDRKGFKHLNKLMLEKFFEDVFNGKYPDTDAIVKSFELNDESSKKAKDYLNEVQRIVNQEESIHNQNATDEEVAKFGLESDWSKRSDEISKYLSEEFDVSKYEDMTVSQLESRYGKWDDKKGVVIEGKTYLEHPYERIGCRLLELKKQYMKDWK